MPRTSGFRPYNKANGGAFVNAISRFVKSPDTQVIEGTFRGQPAIHYVNPETACTPHLPRADRTSVST